MVCTRCSGQCAHTTNEFKVVSQETCTRSLNALAEEFAKRLRDKTAADSPVHMRKVFGTTSVKKPRRLLQDNQWEGSRKASGKTCGWVSRKVPNQHRNTMLLKTSTKGPACYPRRLLALFPRNSVRTPLEKLWKAYFEDYTRVFRQFSQKSWESRCRKPSRQPFLGHLWQFFRQLSTKALWALLDHFLKESQWTALQPLGGHRRPPYPQFNGGEARQV